MSIAREPRENHQAPLGAARTDGVVGRGRVVPLLTELEDVLGCAAINRALLTELWRAKKFIGLATCDSTWIAHYERDRGAG